MRYFPKIKGFFYLLIFVSTFLTLTPSLVLGQEVAENKVGFTLSPPSNEYDSKQGDSLTGVIKVANLSDEEIQLVAVAESFVAYGDTGQVAITEDEPSFSIKKWIKIDDPEKTVKPRSELTFNYTIDIPKNAEPGSHYGAIVVSNKPPKVKGQTGASVQQSIGSLILIKLPGDVSDQTNLVSFTSEKEYYTEPKVKFNVVLENVGNVHTKVGGSIDIYDIFNNKVKTLTLEAKNVLPDNKRSFEAEGEFEYVGPFSAKLNMVYGANNEITGTTSFWAFYLEKTLKIAGIILFVLIFYLIFRKRINKAVKVIVKGE